jgi:MATE family multidrug resistance protein
MVLVDTAVLGRVSVTELAGAALGRAIAFASLAMGMGIASALEPIASQALGAGDRARAWGALGTTQRTVLVAWAPTVIASFALTLALEPLGVEASVVSRVRAFLTGMTPGMLMTLLFLATKTFLQAHGATRPALVGAAVANVTNFAVSNLLVRGDDALAAVHLPRVGLPTLGALGAGLAFSVAASVLYAITMRAAWAFREGSGVRVPMRQVARLGIPAGLLMLAETGVFTAVSLLAGTLGERVVSAHQVTFGLASFTFMGALGVSGATAVRVGRAIGEGRSPRQAGTLGIGLGAGVMTVGAYAFAAFPRELVALFTADPGVIDLGASLVRIAALFQLFDGAQTVTTGALRGAGDVRVPFIANVAAHYLCGLPVALVLCFGLGWGARGLWWGLTAGLVVVAAVLAARFLAITRGAVRRV